MIGVTALAIAIAAAPSAAAAPDKPVQPAPPAYGVNAPANDNFGSCQRLGSGDPTQPVTGPVAGNNIGATAEAGEPSPVLGSATSSVWYCWTAPHTGTARLSTHGSNYDTTLAAFTGSSVSGLTLHAANDDTNGTLQSLISFAVTRGTQYRIQLGGYNGLQGNISLQVTVGPPGNDLFSARQAIGGAAGTVTGTNYTAIGEPGEPGFFTFPDGSVWYTWVSPFNGNAQFTTCGSNYDTVLAAATGGFITGLTQLTVNDDSACGLQSVIVFAATANTTYQIWVDGYSTWSRGNLQLNWSQV